MERKLLLIIDPQVDFISGTLPVPGAGGAMDALAKYVEEHGDEYAGIVISADSHPMHHMSFAEEGGEWPRHCVADSVGAAVWPALMDSLIGLCAPVEVLHKGECPDVEEYSVFSNSAAAERIRAIVARENIGTIDICGLAGDVCVARSLEEGIACMGSGKFRLLLKYTPSLDDGATLNALTDKYNIPCIR